jgi:Domain of unknown function (DUF4388)
MQLEGSTQEFPLSDLITMMSQSSATGVLEIRIPEHVGRIFCHDGQVYHAETSDQTGFEAFRTMLQADDAPFRFIFGVRHGDATLWPDTLSLISYVRQQEQLHRHMCHHIPTLECVLRLRPSSGSEAVQLSATIWPALALIDGQRSVAEIADLLGHEPFEVGTLLGQLVARGLATVKAPQTATTSSEQPAGDAPPDETAWADAHTAPAGPATSIGFFERLLTGRPAEHPATNLPRRRRRLPHLIFS